MSKEDASDAINDLLRKYGMADLPEVFSIRDDAGGVTQERDATYHCEADCFLGKGTYGTWYQEGSIVVTIETPNAHMKPLNLAAAKRYVRWAESLTQADAKVDIGDISEAMTMLASRPDFLQMTPDQRSEAAMKFAVRLKMKRDGKDARELPGLSHNFTSVNGSKAPPILGAKMSDMAQRAPGETRNTAAIPVGQSGGVRKEQEAIGGLPPGR